MGQPESFGLLTVDYTGMRGAWKLLDLATMLADAGVQRGPPVNLTECVFNPILNPIQGNGFWRNYLVFSMGQIRNIILVSLFLCGFCCLLALVQGVRLCCRVHTELGIAEWLWRFV